MAQGTISVNREKVLGTYGTVESANTPISPLAAGPGRVFTQNVGHSGATAVRFHFTVLKGVDLAYWTVVVTGADGRKWEHGPSGPTDSEFWSDETTGDLAQVELVSTVASPPVRLVIDQVAWATVPTVPRSVVGDALFGKWKDQKEPILTLGRSVVRLRFVDDVHKKIYVCTAWLVFSNLYLLTNNHCINTEAEAKSALADVDYNEEDGVPARSVRLRRIVMTDVPLDFSLLELEQPLDRPPLVPGAPVTSSQKLVIIEHPGGQPKQVSADKDCKVGLASVPGITNATTDFEHGCDTLGGSSGSSVFDAASFTVVGLHHLGFDATGKAVNRAVHIGKVIAAIQAKYPNIATGAPSP